MPLSLVERILSQAGQDALVRQVHFHVMGDPLLHPDLPEAVRLARHNGMEAWVTTNGSLLTAELLRALREAGLSHLTISLQTPDAATFALRGSGRLAFEEYRARLIGAVRTCLAEPGPMRLTICFLANPLRRFRAPDAPTTPVAESGAALRSHMKRWLEWIFGETTEAARISHLVARTRRAGILRETRFPLTPRLDFQVRILGDWAGHFDGPTTHARVGYCPGLSENLGVLWNGDYVICCTDYDGQTVLANASDVSLRDYLSLPAVQEIASGFRRFRVVHPHCRRCLGDRHPATALFRQLGSIVYFKLYRRLASRLADQEAV
jgi:Radical SAM superfamily/Iron-sulfur cluster-binding domain